MHEQTQSLAPSSAFTLAALVAFVTLWTSLHAAIPTNSVENLDRVRVEKEFREVLSFIQMIRVGGWKVGPAPKGVTTSNLQKRYLQSFIEVNLKLPTSSRLGDLVSDMLLVFLKGQASGQHDSEVNWLSHVVTNKEGVSIDSLKPILILRLTRFVRGLSPVEKVDFLKGWLKHLNRDLPQVSDREISLRDVPLTIDRLESSIFGVLNPHLDVTQEFYLVKIEVEQSIPKFSGSKVPVVYQRGANAFLNGVRLGNAHDLIDFYQPSKMVWQSCSMPAIGELSRLEVASQKLLWVQNCQGHAIDVQSYFDVGYSAFALSNSKTAFVSLHLPSLRLALKWGAANQQKLKFGNWRPSRLDRLMGLSDMKHLVRGAIPAIEYYRSGKPGQGLRLKN